MIYAYIDSFECHIRISVREDNDFGFLGTIDRSCCVKEKLFVWLFFISNFIYFI